jgi:hypothetical protein
MPVIRKPAEVGPLFGEGAIVFFSSKKGREAFARPIQESNVESEQRSKGATYPDGTDN